MTVYVGTFKKDPDAVLDYTWDWSRYLDIDTITNATFTVPAGLNTASSSFTTTTATIFLSGGTAGTNYEVVCRITTQGGRTDDRTILIQCVQR